MPDVVIGIDLSGTTVKAIAIDDQGKILHYHYQPTNNGDDLVWKNAIAKAVLETQIAVNRSDTLIGISAPGLPNANNSAIAFMPGPLQGLENFMWTDFLKARTFILNDALAALMAEGRFGAARNLKNVVLLTLGAVVGGAILIDGKPYQGAFNRAGQLGHLFIDSDGEPDVFGMPGSLEEAIGTCTIEKRSQGRFSSTNHLLEAFRKGDPFAAEVWFTAVRKLAIGLASVTNILSPEIIILSGGMTEADKDLFDPLEEYMDRVEWRAGGNQTPIVKARYGDLAGAVGAACFAREQIVCCRMEEFANR